MELFRRTLGELRTWWATWTPHAKAISITAFVLWCAFAYIMGAVTGTVLLLFFLMIVTALGFLLRGQWRRPLPAVSPLTVLDNAAEKFGSLVTNVGGRWFGPDNILVCLNDADYAELLQHYDMADVMDRLTDAYRDVLRRYYAHTVSGLEPTVTIDSAQQVRRGRFQIAGSAARPPRVSDGDRYPTKKLPDPVKDNLGPARSPLDVPKPQRQSAAEAPTRDMGSSTGLPQVEFRTSDGAVFRVAQESILVGRSMTCDVPISADPLVSRQHATLARGDGRSWWLMPHSQYGCLVNAQHVQPGTWCRLQDGDTVTWGDTGSCPSAVIRFTQGTKRSGQPTSNRRAG